MVDVAVLALDGVIPFELSIPGEVFGTANLTGESQQYDVRVCAPGLRARSGKQWGAFTVHTDWDIDTLVGADIVVIPGCDDFLTPPPATVIDALTAAAADDVRFVSFCVGAFTLAATGLLDGLRATTHWRWAGDLASQYPRVTVDDSVLFTDSGACLTSAGVVSGIDLCLHLVRCDLGAATAAATARMLVAQPWRAGGQAQFVDHAAPADQGTTLQHLLEWMESNSARPIALSDIAQRGSMSIRTLNRQFRDQLGTTPMQWLLLRRIDRAQRLLETTSCSIDRIADETGVGSATTLRYHFSRLVGVPPSVYRKSFKAPSR